MFGRDDQHRHQEQSGNRPMGFEITVAVLAGIGLMVVRNEIRDVKDKIKTVVKRTIY